jgi:ParB-like chromosome segregation protein Spo0J
MTPNDALRAWREAAPQRVNTKAVKHDPALQPRNLALLKLRDQARQEAMREEHIARMAAVLKLSDSAELEPLLLADIDGTLFVVDGYHRLRAYQRAGRAELPARVRATSHRKAAQLSKLVNLDGVKLPMHIEQLREAAWQYLATISARGDMRLPQGVSERSIAADFGIGRATVGRMLERIPQVEHTRYGSEQLDAATGFPQWRFVRATARNQMRDRMTPDQVRDWQADKLARQIGRYAKDLPDDAVRQGLALVLAELEETEGEPEDTLGGPGWTEGGWAQGERIDAGDW